MGSICLAAAVAAAVVLLLGPVVIPELNKLHCGQNIRGEGPKSHQKKSGTPTMGGLIILAGITLGTLAGAGTTPAALLALFVVLGHGAIGFLDDYIKVVKKRNLGLRAREKLAGQLIMAAAVTFIGNRWIGLSTELWLPFTTATVDLSVFYYILVFFVLVGTTNAVNLTDGLDGLAAAILTKTELLLIVIGGVFVVEALSVIIQVISFQTTGRRVFRMSPLHHHFELGGWAETKVVRVFWLAGAVSSVVALLILKAG